MSAHTVPSSPTSDAMTVSIRPLRLVDLRELQRFRESNDDGAESAARGCAAPATCHPGCGFSESASTRTWLAENGEDVIGIVSLTLEGQGVARIHDLSVGACFGDTCVPLLLITAALEDGKRLECLKVRLDASVTSYALLAMLIDGGTLLGASRRSSS